MFTSWFGPSKATLRAEIKRLTLEKDKAQSQLAVFEKNKEQNEEQMQMIMRNLEMDTQKKEEQRREEEERQRRREEEERHRRREEEEKQLLQRENRMREREEHRIHLQRAAEERHQKELEQTRMKMLMLCTSEDPAIKQTIVEYKTRAMQVALIEALTPDVGSETSG